MNCFCSSEVTKSHMTQELSENRTNRAEVNKLDAEIAKIREKLAEVKDQLEESSKETAREKAKNVSLSKHVEVSIIRLTTHKIKNSAYIAGFWSVLVSFLPHLNV